MVAAIDPKADPRFRDFDDFSEDEWVAPTTSLRPLRASDLLEFKRLTDLDNNRDLTLGFANVDPEYLEAGETPADPSDFLITPRAVRLRAVCPIEAEDYADVGVAPWIESTARALAKRFGLKLIDGESQWSGGVAWAVLRFAVPRSLGLDAVLAFHDGLRHLIEHNPADLDEQALWDLLCAELPQGLIGCPESHWFDAKGEPYALDGALGRLELAKDVSAFANSGGGVLVIGLATTKVDGVDVVSRVRPVARALLSPKGHRSALRAALYPRLQGLEFVVAAGGDAAGVMGIRIPRQPVANLPVIVLGMPGIRDRQVEGAYWGIFRRRGDESVPIGAPAVHTAIRGGVL